MKMDLSVKKSAAAGAEQKISVKPPASIRGKRPLRNMTAADKVYAIQRVRNGETKASVSRSIGVPESTLRGWCKNEQKLRLMSDQLETGSYGLRELCGVVDYSCAASSPSPELQFYNPYSLGINSNFDFWNSEKANNFNNIMSSLSRPAPTPPPLPPPTAIADYFLDPSMQPVNNPAIFHSPASILNSEYADLSMAQNLYLMALLEFNASN
ncbi:uncharacterized protein [Musca autumnalis]|uniref:uncharacterized protein n=1 Tax=Musca autumnalis TaxID=221902 RepID=UPI003CEBAC7E